MTTTISRAQRVAWILFTSVLLAGSARADAIFVDWRNPGPGAGTPRDPFQQIGRAVDAARERRAEGTSHGATVIHVASGSYTVPAIAYAVDRFTGVDAPPGSLLLDVPDLTILGETRFDVDDRGIPTGVVANATILEVQGSLANQATIVRITADRVTLAGLVIDGHDAPFAPIFNRAVDVDGQAEMRLLTGISIRRNLIRNVIVGIQSRLASMSIDQNFFPGGANTSTVVCAGSVDDPAVVSFTRNRSTGNRNGAGFLGVTNNNKPPVDVDAALDARLVVEIADNDLRGNGVGGAAPGSGLNISLDGLTGNPNQPAAISAYVHDNLLGDNPYGVVVRNLLPANLPFGPSFPEIPSYQTNVPGEFALTFAGNDYANARLAPALFTFTTEARSIRFGTPGYCATSAFFSKGFTFDVTHDGELSGFHFDNPDVAFDALNAPGGTVVTCDGAPVLLGNTLEVNGIAYTGRSALP